MTFAVKRGANAHDKRIFDVATFTGWLLQTECRWMKRRLRDLGAASPGRKCRAAYFANQ